MRGGHTRCNVRISKFKGKVCAGLRLGLGQTGLQDRRSSQDESVELVHLCEPGRHHQLGLHTLIGRVHSLQCAL